MHTTFGMRIVSSVIALVVLGQGLALADDPRVVMRAAMLAQIDAHPHPPMPLGEATAPSRFVGSHETTGLANHAAEGAAAAQLGPGNATPNAMAHQAQAASSSAAAQAQSSAAQNRTKNHPHVTR